MHSVINIATEETASSRHGAHLGGRSSRNASYKDDCLHTLENIKKLPEDDKLSLINNLGVTYEWNKAPPTQRRAQVQRGQFDK